MLYYMLPAKWKWVLLLAASYFFYAYWKVEYLVLIVLSTLVDYTASHQIEKSSSNVMRRLWLTASLSTNIGLLFLFKYLKLFLPPKDLMHLSIKAAESPLIGELQYALYLVIPVGISFYTFQTMAYTVDVYRQRIKAEKHLGKFALYVCFFPQLVAGPIERFDHLRPQLNSNFFNLENIKNGLRLILFGFFLKLCIADNLAQTVDPVYADPSAYSGLNIIIGTFLFGLQIYGDFAGYSLIAQGSALLIGVNLMDNFRTPYLSSSISEFWSRWHISLSTWFRDYLYIPLGGNRKGIPRWVLSILIVFAISGFWHGAEWTFLIWGGIHGLLYLLEKLLSIVPIKGRLRKALGWPLTLIPVCIAWVFFRAENMDAVEMIYQSFITNPFTTELENYTSLSFSSWFAIPALLFILSEVILYNKRFDHWIASRALIARWGIYLMLLFCLAVLGGAVNHPFIYFQF